MSREGNPYDNAVMESFYRTLKRELVQDAHYENPEQARQQLHDKFESQSDWITLAFVFVLDGRKERSGEL